MFSSALAFARRGSLESRTPDKRGLCVERVEVLDRIKKWLGGRVF